MIKAANPFKQESDFEVKLKHLLNSYGCDTDSSTPDFILASYLAAALDNFVLTMKKRDAWYERE
jgi:hypothetical protein